MKQSRITVTKQTDSGRNTGFHDNYNGNNLTRTQFVHKINNGYYNDYHVRIVNGIATPCSNPDNSRNNNLG